MITLIAILCPLSADIQSGRCIDSIVTDTHISHDMSITGCMGVQGLNSAIQHFEVHPLRDRGWRVKGWKCEIGKRGRLGEA